MAIFIIIVVLLLFSMFTYAIEPYYVKTTVYDVNSAKDKVTDIYNIQKKDDLFLQNM